MRQKDWLTKLVPAAALLVLLFRFPHEMTDGVRQGLTLCGTAVIPSLFPFLVFCTFFVRSGLCATVGEKLSRPMRKLLRLPPVAAGAVLLGLCGGYPVGARMTAQLLEEGSVTRSQAQRMCLFCVAAGPAFVTGTVGASLLGSREAGWLLFGALTLANLTVGVLLRFTDAEPQTMLPTIPRQPFARCFCEAVADAGGSMLSVCAWVLLFSGICAVLETLPPSVSTPLVCVLEVTNGCRTGAANGLSLPVLAAILGFGGLSVHCQIFAALIEVRVNPLIFFLCRVTEGIIAMGAAYIFLMITPMQSAVFSSSDVPVSAARSATYAGSGALVLAALCFVGSISSKLRRMKVCAE
jgi:sporulation integral membrane protein YlbJ